MADKLKRALRVPRRILSLLAISAKLDLMWLLRDTKYALTGIVGDLIFNVSTLSSIYLIALRFGGIGGMGTDEVLFMLAYSTITTGLFIMFGSGNNFHISRIIGRGQLDHMHMQPLPLGVQMCTSGFSPFTGSGDLIMGAAVMAWAVRRLALPVTPLWLTALIGYILCTMVVIVARSYLFSSAAFYAPVAAEEISTTVIEGTWLLSTFPLSGMPPWVQVGLLTILPEGLLAWFPSLCLLGRPPLGLTAIYPLAYALLLTLLTSLVFMKGLKHYVNNGSNRYVPYGFRR